MALGACAAVPPPETAVLQPLPPSGLVGMAGSELPQYLGPPSLRRHEGAAEIWQYAAPECLLYLFLYLDQGRPVIRHAEARDRRRRPADVAGCARAIGAQRAAARANAAGG
ncbi:hypothetical protein DES42_107259 [Zavarzinia compransoris]|uniref:Lipoprotein SmpA/OmlA domain-containing protein n=1 Tax=Zavarzinia compransoris TaxID=1264899 RepID=A0A317E2N8_9PROT|nr:hypothetical protein DKG75_11845 [Zavarzinia compransoris]TDP44491.1 hypothetical protein DES42_107259 [Zavarzinia compransoris]